jgi:uncharacterized membrane protein
MSSKRKKVLEHGEHHADLQFGRENFIWMGAGIAVIALGMLLMAGGKSDDATKFLQDEVYSERRITIAPLLIVIGLVLEIVGIFKKPSTK